MTRVCGAQPSWGNRLPVIISWQTGDGYETGMSLRRREWRPGAGILQSAANKALARYPIRGRWRVADQPCMRRPYHRAVDQGCPRPQGSSSATTGNADRVWEAHYSMEAHYRCRRCRHRWTGIPGPTKEDGASNTCPKCGHDYFEWLNWEEIVTKVYREKYGEKGR